MEDLQSTAALSINGAEVPNVIDIKVGEREVRGVQPTMSGPKGYRKIVGYPITIEIALPTGATAEADWEAMTGATISVEPDDAPPLEFQGAFCTKVGEASWNAEAKATTRTVEFMAPRKSKA